MLNEVWSNLSIRMRPSLGTCLSEPRMARVLIASTSLEVHWSLRYFWISRP
jgi:hypothetical protein